jgi:carboxypeptidase PM20D1
MTGPIAMIGVAGKGLLDLELRAEAPGGHASTPTRGGATATLARAIVRLDEHPFPTNLPAATVAMLKVMATRLRAPLGKALAVLTGRPRLLAAALQRAGAEPAAMTRTTTAITQLRGSRGANVIATTATATVNLRIMVGESVDGTIERVRRIVRDKSITLTALSSSEPSPIAPVDEAFELLGATLADVMPDVVPAPYVVMAATDGRFFQQSFPRVYRFNPCRMSAELRRTLHNVDERIDVQDYLEGIRWYEALLERL